MFPFSFVIAIIAMSMAAWVITTWIRVKHGYPLDDGAGNPIEPRDTGEVTRLRIENERLTDQLENYGDRLEVLERIITDKGYDVAQQIEALRDHDVRIEDKSEAK